MKQKVLFLALVLFCGMQAMATNLVVERYAGAEMVQDIAVIGKWVFVDSQLQLLDKAGNVLASEPIANVRKIVFSNESTAVDNVENSSIVIYPNPTLDILYVKGIESQTLRVYDMQGRVVQSTNATAISVEHLATGTYLLQISQNKIQRLTLFTGGSMDVAYLEDEILLDFKLYTADSTLYHATYQGPAMYR